MKAIGKRPAFLITGCSGGGKSTLVEHLARRGFDVVHEPGLRIIKGGGPKPWVDRAGFIQAVVNLSRQDLESIKPAQSPIFFDRGIFDALSGLAAMRNEPLSQHLPDGLPYAQPVFFAPPWPEIYAQSDDRPHSFSAAQEESHRLWADLKPLGVRAVTLPKSGVEQRADFVLDQLAL